jgi:DNA-binding transcriptional regulator GbsR (MarR family)
MSHSDPDAAREEVIEAMARSIEMYGANQSYGRLYGILFFAEEPMSLDTLTEESGYAKSTVSTAMESLSQIHLIHRQSIPGEGKKAYYEAETDWWYVFQEVLNQEVMREIRIMGRALDSAAETLADAESEKTQRDFEKIRKLQRLFARSEQLVELLTGQSLNQLVSMLKQARATDAE